MPINPAAAKAGAMAAANITKVTLKTGSLVANKVMDTANNHFSDLQARSTPSGTNFERLAALYPRLESKIKLCQEIKEELGDIGLSSTLNNIIEEASSSLFKIMFLGRYNAGKSSLLNAILDMDILPEGAAPTTKKLTWILPGPEASCFCEKESGEISSVDLDALKSSNSGLFNDTRNILITAPHPFLSSGVALIDTPGFSSTDERDSEKASLACKEADAIVFVTDNYFTGAERDFLCELHGKGRSHNIFIVLNKTENIPDEELQEVLEDRVSELNKIGIRAKIFPLSAKIKDFKSGKPMAEFKRALGEFMGQNLERARANAVESRIDDAMTLTKEACLDAISLRKGNSNLGLTRQKIKKDAEDIEAKLLQISKKEDREIDRAHLIFTSNWNLFYRNLCCDLKEKIAQATEDQLRRPDFIESQIMTKTCEFLTQEVQCMMEGIKAISEEELNEISPELPINRLNLGNPNPRSISAVDPKLIMATALVVGFPMMSITGWAKLFIISTFGSSLVEKVISGATLNISLISLRRELSKNIDDQMPLLDKEIRATIDKFCDDLKGLSKDSFSKRASSITGRSKLLNYALSDGAEQNRSIEQLQIWMDKIDTYQTQI